MHNNNIDFPYKKDFFFKNHHNFLSQLRKYKPKLIQQSKINKLNIKFKKSPFEYLAKDNFLFKLGDKYVVFEDSWWKYKYINEITDFFSEICRMKCTFYTEKHSPYHYFYNNHNKLINDIKKTGTITKKRLREAVYNNIKECTLFNITVVINILKYFKVKKWLDFSAGWGDRLIGAITCDIDLYVGVDPSECMNKVYPKIIEKLVEPNKRDKFKIIQSPFEDAVLPNETYDLVFTSPPFFDLEVYNDEKTQSVKKHDTFFKWMEYFLLFSIKKSWDKLIKGGHMVLYIPDEYNGNLISPQVNQYIIRTLNGKKLGKMYYYYKDNKKIKGIFVWKKV